jgi:CHAP domain
MGERRSRMGLWLWLAGGAGVTGLVVVAIFALAVAVLGASFTGCQPSAAPAAPMSGPTPSAYAVQSIPPERLRLYEQAGTRFDIDWSFLASIGAQECGNGECAGTNSSGCAGPMQIAYVRGSACSPSPGPTLWERYAVNADPGHPLSVNNPADAIYTAARILREDMGAPPTGGSYAEYRQAACHYYGACADSTVSYADEVMARAVQYGFTSNGAPAASSPPLAQPVSTQGCEAAVFTPEAASSSAIVKVAESQVGQGATPPRSDCTIYGPCEEWCSLFAAWVWQHAGVPLPGQTAAYGYSGSLYTWVREHHGRILPATARSSPGDAVFYGTGPSDSAHVGIVAQVLADGRIVTVEGNYKNKVSRVGPFPPASPIGEKAAIYGYAQPPGTTQAETRPGTITHTSTVSPTRRTNR